MAGILINFSPQYNGRGFTTFVQIPSDKSNISENRVHTGSLLHFKMDVFIKNSLGGGRKVKMYLCSSGQREYIKASVKKRNNHAKTVQDLVNLVLKYRVKY